MLAGKAAERAPVLSSWRKARRSRDISVKPHEESLWHVRSQTISPVYCGGVTIALQFCNRTSAVTPLDHTSLGSLRSRLTSSLRKHNLVLKRRINGETKAPELRRTFRYPAARSGGHGPAR